MDRCWKIVDTKYGKVVIPIKNFECIWCGKPLLLHCFRVSYCNKGFYHCDVNMKCPVCDWFVVFGVPISEEEFKELRMSQLHGVEITKEAIEIAKIQSINVNIESRLKSLGYW